MDLTKQYQEQQEAKRLQNRISSFMGSFKVGTLLNNRDREVALVYRTSWRRK